jgi:hypothetical protein
VTTDGHHPDIGYWIMDQYEEQPDDSYAERANIAKDWKFGWIIDDTIYDGTGNFGGSDMQREGEMPAEKLIEIYQTVMQTDEVPRLEDGR